MDVTKVFILPVHITVEFCAFTFAVIVLSLSLVMFVRLYDALSPPTKCIVSVVAANRKFDQV